MAKKRGYDVLDITEHDEVNFTDEMLETADKAAMLLLPGIEASVGKGKDHILIINTPSYPAEKINLWKV